MRPATPTSHRRAGLLQALGMSVGAFILGRHGHPTAALALRSLAGAVTVLALARPSWLAALNRGLGRAATAVLLALVYALAVVPTRALLAVLRVDPLAPPKRADEGSHWLPRDTPVFAREDFERTS